MFPSVNNGRWRGREGGRDRKKEREISKPHNEGNPALGKNWAMLSPGLMK